MEEKQYYVYILASKKYGTLYTGITSNLVQRIWQHKEGFTKKYNVHHLVYYEIHSDVYEAITRENESRNGTDNGK